MKALIFIFCLLSVFGRGQGSYFMSGTSGTVTKYNVYQDKFATAFYDYKDSYQIDPGMGVEWIESAFGLEMDTVNLAVNMGGRFTTDWVDTDGNGIADGFTTSVGTSGYIRDDGTLRYQMFKRTSTTGTMTAQWTAAPWGFSSMRGLIRITYRTKKSENILGLIKSSSSNLWKTDTSFYLDFANPTISGGVHTAGDSSCLDKIEIYRNRNSLRYVNYRLPLSDSGWIFDGSNVTDGEPDKTLPLSVYVIAENIGTYKEFLRGCCMGIGCGINGVSYIDGSDHWGYYNSMVLHREFTFDTATPIYSYTFTVKDTCIAFYVNGVFIDTFNNIPYTSIAGDMLLMVPSYVGGGSSGAKWALRRILIRNKFDNQNKVEKIDAYLRKKE